MRNLKERIEKRSRASSGDVLEIIMIIPIGSWNCSKHNEVIVGRCIGCTRGMCQICASAGSTQFYRCEECGPVFWETRPKRQECNKCGLTFEYDHLINQQYVRKFYDRCCEQTRDQFTRREMLPVWFTIKEAGMFLAMMLSTAFELWIDMNAHVNVVTIFLGLWAIEGF